MSSQITLFQGTDGNTRANMNAKLTQANNHISAASEHITTLSCTKSGTVYALTGLTATSGKIPIMWSVPIAYVAGDTVTIGGVSYTLKTTDNTTLTTGAWAANAIITGVADVDNKILCIEPSAPIGAIPKQMQIYQTTTSYTATGDQSGSLFIVTNTAGATTFTLPATLVGGKAYQIDLLNYSNYPVTVSAGGSSVFLISGTPTSITLPSLCSMRFLSNGGGASWMIASNKAYKSDYADYAGSIALSTPALRNTLIIPGTSSIPTGLPDGTVVLKYIP